MRPLLVTADAALLDAVVAVAQEAGVEIEVASDLGSVTSRAAPAPLVLLDAALADDALLGTALGDAPSHRSGLVAVSLGLDDAATWRRAAALGAEQVVELPAGTRWLVDRLRRSVASGRPAEVVGVVGAAGGTGASTLAAAIASHAARAGDPSTLVDLDPWGGGLDLLLGVEDAAGARWDELATVELRLDPAALVASLPEVDGVRLLSWPATTFDEPDLPAADYVVEALAHRPGVVVLDAGRGHDQRASALLARCDRLVLVVPLRVRAVTAARRQLRMLPAAPQLLVVAREVGSTGVSTADVERALGRPISAVLATDRRRAEVEELGGGMPTGPAWRRACDALLAAAPTVAA